MIMKKGILFILLIGLEYSCSTSKILNDEILIGKFEGTSKGTFPNTSIQYFLELSRNNTFNFRIKGHDYRPECTGIWDYKSDTIFLKCNEEKDISVLLSSSYMNQREFKIAIKNRNKLKLDNVVLKRKQ